MPDLFHTIAADRLRNAGYSVSVNLANDRFRAFIRGVCFVSVRLKNSCIPENLIWKAEKAAEMVKAAGRL